MDGVFIAVRAIYWLTMLVWLIVNIIVRPSPPYTTWMAWVACLCLGLKTFAFPQF